MLKVNGGLTALATDLPAAIIADLLGLHVNTAGSAPRSSTA